MKVKRHLPWYTRIAAKLVLSRLPAGYAFWNRLDLFSHGAMDRADYALEVFRKHCAHIAPRLRSDGFVALELGPGDSVLSALIAAGHGARTCYLVDAGPFATKDVEVYRKAAVDLRAAGMACPDLADFTDFDAICAACDARYLTRGLDSLRAIPDSSVDFIWSNAVLEHVRRRDFAPMMREVRRVLKDDGICSHTVDLQDHLGGGLNNLRIGSRLWEADWMAASGFYTNRIRMAPMLAQFADAGFRAEVVSTLRWDRPPIRRRALAAEFRDLADDELCVRGFDVVLRPR